MPTEDTITGLSDPDLIHAHARSHYLGKSVAEVTAHHLFCSEMSKRGIAHGHEGDDWSEPLEISRLEKAAIAELVTKSDLPVELLAALRQALEEGYTFADVIGLLTLQGYAFTLVPIGDPAPAEETDSVDCPDCVETCACGSECSCWSGCKCADCVKPVAASASAPSILKRFFDKIEDRLGLNDDPALAPVAAAARPITKSITSNTDLPAVSKALTEARFTLAPMYVPNFEDAHGEWTDSVELQKAVWDYVKSGDRGIRLQHNVDVVAGEWLEIMTMPYEFTVPMYKADGSEYMATYPPGTVFMGVQWSEWAWELVKSGKVRGYSIGGLAGRVEAEIPEPGLRKALAPAIPTDTTPVRTTDLVDLIAHAVKSAIPAPQEIRVVMPEAAPQVEKKVSRRIDRDAEGNITRIVEE